MKAERNRLLDRLQEIDTASQPNQRDRHQARNSQAHIPPADDMIPSASDQKSKGFDSKALFRNIPDGKLSWEKIRSSQSSDMIHYFTPFRSAESFEAFLNALNHRGWFQKHWPSHHQLSREAALLFFYAIAYVGLEARLTAILFCLSPSSASATFVKMTNILSIFFRWLHPTVTNHRIIELNSRIRRWFPDSNCTDIIDTTKATTIQRPHS